MFKYKPSPDIEIKTSNFTVNLTNYFLILYFTSKNT